MTFDFTAGGAPVPQGSISVFRGRAVPVNGTKLRKWRATVEEAAREAMPEDWNNRLPVVVSAGFMIERPMSHLTAKGRLRKGAPFYLSRRPDLDKLARAVGDSLTSAGVVVDDSQIISWVLSKEYTTGPPGVIVTVIPLNG